MKCPNGHEVNGQVKFCPTCGADLRGTQFCTNCGGERNGDEEICPHYGSQMTDESKYCSECGKEYTQGNECPHCGVSVNDSDTFCYKCGRSLNKVQSSESFVYEKKVSKSRFKKYLSYIIGAFVLLMIIGYCSSNNSSNVIDSTEETTKKKTDGKDYTETDIKNVVEEMYKELFSLENEFDFDGKYTSNEYKSLYKKAESIADEPIIDADHWTDSQDSDNPSLKSISVKKYSDTTAKANVAIKLFKDDETITHVKLALIYEGGRWVVDDFLTDYNGEENSEKAYLKKYIEDSLNKPKNDFSWLQGHWVYEQGNYKGHFVIQGNTLTMYSTMNPEPLTYTYRVEGNELFAGEMTVKLDFANQRIDYGEGNWMHKTSSDSNAYSSSSSNSSSQSRTFANEQYVTMYLANQSFKNSSGVDIRIDGSLRMYIDGDYAGVISVLRYNATSAMLRFGGGAYGDGKIGVRIENNRLILNDPIDGTTWYQK